MKKVLITGITGMVGSHLLDFLIKNTDWEIHGIVRWRSSLANIVQHIPAINNKDRIYLHYADLSDLESLEIVCNQIKFDYAFHLAAQSFPKTSFTAANNTYNINIIGTENILCALYKHCPNAIVHNCSSSEVFGRVPKEYVPIKEDTPFHPASPYAISKCGTDLIGRYYAESKGLNVQTTRMFTHTGPRRGDVFMESTFCKQIALIENGFIEPTIRVGNLQSVRTIADVRDAVRAYYMLVTSDRLTPGEVYNIGGTYTATVESILKYLMSLSKNKNLKYQVDHERIRPIDADLQIPDTTKFKNLTGWEPEITFEETMSDLLNYWRDNIRNNGNQYLTR